MADTPDEPVTGAEFDAACGPDWRALVFGARAFFRASSYADGAALVARIAALADELGHRPKELDLRGDGVLVRVATPTAGGLSRADLLLAQRISAVAGEMRAVADVTFVKDVEFAIDAIDAAAIMPFWSAVLGNDIVGDCDLFDPHWRWPGVYVQQMDAPRAQRNRIHIDVFVPLDQVEQRVAAAVAAGGTIVYDARAPMWWTLADPEGNECDLSTYSGR